VHSQTHPDANSTSLVHARRLLRDAQQWAEFGNMEAARALAERAADMGVEWPPGELTPQTVLHQWAGKPSGAPAESRVAFPESQLQAPRGNEADHTPRFDFERNQDPLEFGTASIGTRQLSPPLAPATQTASYQATEFDVRNPAEDSLTQHQELNDLGPTERTALMSRSMPERLSPAQPTSQSTTAGHGIETALPGPLPTAPAPLAPTEGAIASSNLAAIPHSVPIIVSASAPPPAASGQRATIELIAIVGCCAAGFLLSPTLLIAGTIMLGRMFGNFSPLIRIEFRRTEVSESRSPVEDTKVAPHVAVPPVTAPDATVSHNASSSSDLFEAICRANLAIKPHNSATQKRAA
jgi:hypothetical protein